VATGANGLTLFGRDDVVQRLAASRARLTVLSGDSGIGKSEVLRAAQVATTDAIAPSPRSLPSSGGVLQRILLDGLGEVLAEDIRGRGGLDEAGRWLAEAAEGVVAKGGQALVRVVGQEVLAVVRGQLGEEVGQAATAYVASLKQAVDERLAVRLDNALDRGAAEVVLALASEVLEHSEPREAVLAIDAGERLRDEDVRVLSDLAEALPPGLRLRVAISTYTAQHQAIVDQLTGVSSGVAEIALSGIGEDGVREWLQSEGESDDLVSDVTRVTGGYALHLGDLIAHLRGGGAIDDAPLHETFARRTEDAWVQLDPNVAHHARRLCVFADPLPVSRALEFLGIDLAEWGETQDRLKRARIFSVEVNGLPWFHEQRRRYLSEIKLGADELAATCTDAVAILRDLTETTQRTDRLSELADLAIHATSLLDDNEQLRVAVGLDLQQLALCASLVELMEPKMTFPAIDGNALLRHTRQVFEPAGDLVQAFRELGSNSLVQVVEQRHAAVVAPSFNGLLVMLVIIGRAQRDLGRTPVPRAAGTVFETEIRPRLEPYLGVGYGIGHQRMAKLGEQAVTLRRKLAAPVLVVGNRGDGPDLLLRGRYAGRAFYTHASFDSVERRDEARERLDGLSVEIFDQRFEVTDLIDHPVEPVPSGRFLQAAQRVLGKDLKLGHDGVSGKRDLASPMSAEQRLSLRAGVLQVVRTRSSMIERYAVELDQPIGFLYFENGDSIEIAEVIGGREDARPAPSVFGRPRDDPFEIYRIEELGDLAAHERVGIATFSVSHIPRLDDPAVDTLTDLAKRATRFNATQRQLVLTFDETDLQHRLMDAVNMRLEDARALYDSGVFGGGGKRPTALSHEVIVDPLPEAVPRLFEGRWWNGRVVVRAIDQDHDEVRLRISGRRLPDHLFDELPDDCLECTQGSADQIIATLLGYRDADVRFETS